MHHSLTLLVPRRAYQALSDMEQLEQTFTQDTRVRGARARASFEVCAQKRPEYGLLTTTCLLLTIDK